MKKLAKHLQAMMVKPEKKISLKKHFSTSIKNNPYSKKEEELLFAEGLASLTKMQDKLYAHDQYSVLIIFQAMDAAGKDGAIKHVMSGLNPQGVKVHSFKVPSSVELDHDYFWRYYKALPARGEVGIFNRSHYENVLVTRVHPEYILDEQLPHINSLKHINAKFWEDRYKQINRFEKNLAENGVVILKFFLYVSKEEQKRRFLERIDNPVKNWKFSMADINERKHWDKYMNAYEQMLPATSTDYAPWFVVPADDKRQCRLSIASIINRQFEKLNLSYPKLNQQQMEHLKAAKRELEAEH